MTSTSAVISGAYDSGKLTFTDATGALTLDTQTGVTYGLTYELYGNLGGLVDSKSFTLTVICGVTSATITAPASFATQRSVIYVDNTRSTFAVTDVFISSNPLCNTFTYAGMTSQAVTSMPAGMSFYAPLATDGNGAVVTSPTFQTTNVVLIGAIATYDVTL